VAPPPRGGGLGEAFNDTILPYWNIMCIFVMFVL